MQLLYHQKGDIPSVYILWNWTDGLVQDCSNSIANALELQQSCTKPSKHSSVLQKFEILHKEEVFSMIVKNLFLFCQLPHGYVDMGWNIYLIIEIIVFNRVMWAIFEL